MLPGRARTGALGLALAAAAVIGVVVVGGRRDVDVDVDVADAGTPLLDAGTTATRYRARARSNVVEVQAVVTEVPSMRPTTWRPTAAPTTTPPCNATAGLGVCLAPHRPKYDPMPTAGLVVDDAVTGWLAGLRPKTPVTVNPTDSIALVQGDTRNPLFPLPSDKGTGQEYKASQAFLGKRWGFFTGTALRNLERAKAMNMSYAYVVTAPPPRVAADQVFHPSWHKLFVLHELIRVILDARRRGTETPPGFPPAHTKWLLWGDSDWFITKKGLNGTLMAYLAAHGNVERHFRTNHVVLIRQTDPYIARWDMGEQMWLVDERSLHGLCVLSNTVDVGFCIHNEHQNWGTGFEQNCVRFASMQDGLMAHFHTAGMRGTSFMFPQETVRHCSGGSKVKCAVSGEYFDGEPTPERLEELKPHILVWPPGFAAIPPPASECPIPSNVGRTFYAGQVGSVAQRRGCPPRLRDVMACARPSSGLRPSLHVRFLNASTSVALAPRLVVPSAVPGSTTINVCVVWHPAVRVLGHLLRSIDVATNNGAKTCPTPAHVTAWVNASTVLSLTTDTPPVTFLTRSCDVVVKVDENVEREWDFLRGECFPALPPLAEVMPAPPPAYPRTVYAFPDLFQRCDPTELAAALTASRVLNETLRRVYAADYQAFCW